MSEVKKIHHIALLVKEMDPALVLWRDLLGVKNYSVEDKPEEHAKVAFLHLGDADIELVEPTAQDDGLTRYLEKHGEGIHHICLEVQGLEELLNRLKFNGIQLINEIPNEEPDGKRYAFIHPKSTFGVLIELYEFPDGA